MYSRRLVGLALCSLVALAVASGCAAPAGDDAASQGGAVTADQANDAAFALRSHPVTGFAAAPENVKALGITTWDVFTSADAKDKFQGGVFYASDADHDVKYVFVIDLDNPRLVVMTLSKDGKTTAPVLDEATYSKLLVDVQRLQTHIAELEKANNVPLSGVSTKALGNGDKCALRSAGLIVGAVAVAGVAFYAGAFAVGSAVGTAAMEALGVGALIAQLNVMVGGGAIAASVAAVGGAIKVSASNYWQETKTSCSSAWGR